MTSAVLGQAGDDASRGALADLSQLSNLDLARFDESALNLGNYEDGLYGPGTGQNPDMVTGNEDIFEQAGEPIAHDTTWTWDDYNETSRRIGEKLDGISGTE